MNVTGLQLAITFTALFVPPYVNQLDSRQFVTKRQSDEWNL